jgi:hypothetical protein
MLQLSQRLGLDLADALARHTNCWPTSSRVSSMFMQMPKRMRSTCSSRGHEGAHLHTHR